MDRSDRVSKPLNERHRPHLPGILFLTSSQVYEDIEGQPIISHNGQPSDNLVREGVAGEPPTDQPLASARAFLGKINTSVPDMNKRTPAIARPA